MTNAEQHIPENYDSDHPEAQGLTGDFFTDAQSIDAEFDQAMNAYAIGDYEAAKAIFSKLATLRPDQSSVFLNLGNACYQMKQDEEAVAYWNKALELDPIEASAYLNIGNVYFSMKSYAQAVHYWEQFTILNRNNANAWLNLGIAYDHLKRPADAMDAYALFLGLKKGTPEAIKIQQRFAESKKVYEHNSAVAEELLEQGKGNKALEIFIKCMERYPGSPKHYKMVAGLLYKKDELDLAEHYYNLSLKQLPDDPTALTNLGVIYEKSHRYIDALWAFNQAHKNASKNTAVLKNRVDMLLNQHQTELQPYLEDTIALHRQYKFKKAHIQINRLADLSACLGDLKQEVAQWRERIEEATNPNLKAAKSYYNQALDAHNTGKFDQAMRFYNKYLSVDSKTARAADVRKRLSEIQNTMGAAVQALLQSDKGF